MTRIELDLVVERKDEKLPRYLTIPRAELAKHGIEGRVTVSGTLGGVPFEGRSVHHWDEERFFVNLPQPLCRKAASASATASGSSSSSLPLREFHPPGL